MRSGYSEAKEAKNQSIDPSTRIVDLRSDTFTQPSPEMREAIYKAELGDDVFGEDPTVNRLEQIAANMFGMEDATFVASGTMGNIAAALTHCTRGDEMIVGEKSHMFNAEAGAASALGGIAVQAIANDSRLLSMSLEAGLDLIISIILQRHLLVLRILRISAEAVHFLLMK